MASVLFLLWKELWRFKFKESMLFVEKNRNFNKSKTELKIQNLTHSFREMILVLQCASVILMLVLLCACVLSQCIVYWIKFQNGYIFTYQKTSLDTVLLLVFKITESLQCILKLKNVFRFWNFKVFKNWCGMFLKLRKS